MSQHVDRFQKSFPAGADHSSNQYRFVKLNSSRQVIRGAGPTDKIVGIIQDKPAAAGRAASVAILGAGTSKLVCSGAAGAISAGDALTCDSVGRGELCDAATDLAYVQALEAVGASETAVEIEVRLDYTGTYNNA